MAHGNVEIMQFLEESSCSFVEFGDLTDKFRQTGISEENLIVSKTYFDSSTGVTCSGRPVVMFAQKQLDQLIQDGRLGRRKAFGTTLYWLKSTYPNLFYRARILYCFTNFAYQLIVTACRLHHHRQHHCSRPHHLVPRSAPSSLVEHRLQKDNTLIPQEAL